MKVLDPGHSYDLNTLDGFVPLLQSRLTFVKRYGVGYPGNIGQYPGTTCQEVLRALIDRVQYLNKQIPSKWNTISVFCLRVTLFCFEKRAAQRHGVSLSVSVLKRIEKMATCTRCGHVACHCLWP